MLTAVLGWLATNGASVILGFVAQVIGDMVKDARDRKAIEDLAAARAQKEETDAENSALKASLDASVNAPKNIPDAIKELRAGNE